MNGDLKCVVDKAVCNCEDPNNTIECKVDGIETCVVDEDICDCKGETLGLFGSSQLLFIYMYYPYNPIFIQFLLVFSLIIVLYYFSFVYKYSYNILQ